MDFFLDTACPKKTQRYFKIEQFPFLTLIQNAILYGAPGFRLTGHNLTNITYADDTAIIANTEKKLQEVARGSEKKGLAIKYKERECMIIRLTLTLSPK